MSTTTTRAAAVGAIALTLGLSVSACGEGTAGTTSGSAPSATPTSPATPGLRILPAQQPDPVPGVVQVDGGRDNLTAYTVHGASGHRGRGFERSSDGRGIKVEQGFSGESRAFQRLCIGQVDVVDSSRPMSPAEWAQCHADGLGVVQLQVAADAVVLAIKSESDVGTDCLSTGQVHDAFAQGSTVQKWSDLDPAYDDVAFHAGGPGVDTDAVGFFGRYVLADPEPVGTDFRTDFTTTHDEDGTRELVTGLPADQKKVRNLQAVTLRHDKLARELHQQWKYWKTAHHYRLDAVSEQKKGIRTHRSPQDRADDDQRVSDSYVAESAALVKVHAARAQLNKVLPRYRVATAAAKRIAGTDGTVGIFSEGYYATFENFLRPFEIQVNDGTQQQNCIFPSPQTILNGEYPLSRQLLLTVTTRALRRPEVASFLTYYLEHSQETALNQGVVPLPNTDIERQLGWLVDGPLPRMASVGGGPVEIQDTASGAGTNPADTHPPAR